MSWLSPVENLKLTSGIVSFDGLVNARILLNDFTHLGKLELRRFEHPKDVQLPWEQITSLKLDNSSVDLCMSLLVRCLNFVEFHAMNCIKPKEHHNLRLSGHAHEFKHLAWGFDDWLDCEFLSHQFRFPSLRTFYWDSPYPYSSRRSTEEEMGALRSLFSNFPPSLSQLLLVESLAWSDEFMEFVFVKLKGLKMIYLSDCKRHGCSVPVTTQQDEWLGALLHFAITCSDHNWTPTYGQ